MLPLFQTDFYKVYHWAQYDPKTEYVYSNTTARKSRLEGVNEAVVFGISYFVQEYLINNWKENFFDRSIEEVIAEYHRVIDVTIGKHAVNEEQIRYLHSLGYLPVKVKALPEGSLCPIGTPFITIINTDPKCYWLTNFIETISQTALWQPITSATIALRYKKLLTEYAEETSDCPEFVQWQGHDFSMRGMSSFESSCVSATGHLLSFTGTDTVPAILFLEKYYGADVTKEMVGASVTASEHSVQCSHYCGEDNEDAYISRMLEIQPDGIVSIVCDGYDYWRFITNSIVRFKDQIMGRNGKVVLRPDTGDPVKIITGYFPKKVPYTLAEARTMEMYMTASTKLWNGDHDAILTTDGYYLDMSYQELTTDEVNGSIVTLYNIFGGFDNSKGYIDLDPHVGLIYGDSITYERCEEICARLKDKGFASTNVVFGIGSYTYQYNTRDTLGLACKATWVQIDGKAKNIFKSPKTGDSMKKSACGLLQVVKENGKIVLNQKVTIEEENFGELKVVYENGVQYNKPTLLEIRERLNG